MTSTIAPTKAPAVAPSRMNLAAVVRGKLVKPPRVLMYGTIGCGKSTFGSRAPAPIFLAAEDGTSELDVARFPEPASWPDALAALDSLLNEEHAYKTLVIDTLDWLEPLIHAHLCHANGWLRNGAPDIEQPGYGKGYTAALDQWRLLLSRLDALRARKGMIIVLLAHAAVRTFKNPAGDDFDRYELKLNAKAAALVREWADAVLFVNYETLTAKEKNRVRGISTGARFMFTDHRAAWDAKNRYGMPEQLPLSWDEFATAVASGHAPEADELRAEIDALLPQVEADVRLKAEEYLARNSGSSAALSQLANRLRAKVALSNAHQPADAGGKEVAA